MRVYSKRKEGNPISRPNIVMRNLLGLQLLLGSELVSVSALLLSAVSSSGRKSGVALSANHLLAVVLSGEDLERGLDGATTQAENQVEGRLLLDVVVRKGSAVFELLSSEDQSLLIRGDSLLVLDLGLDVIDSVRGLDVEGDGLTREGLDEDLHVKLTELGGEWFKQ